MKIKAAKEIFLPSIRGFLNSLKGIPQNYYVIIKNTNPKLIVVSFHNSNLQNWKILALHSNQKLQVWKYYTTTGRSGISYFYVCYLSINKC
jgi:hypothetical protein